MDAKTDFLEFLREENIALNPGQYERLCKRFASKASNDLADRVEALEQRKNPILEFDETLNMILSDLRKGLSEVRERVEALETQIALLGKPVEEFESGVTTRMEDTVAPAASEEWAVISIDDDIVTIKKITDEGCDSTSFLVKYANIQYWKLIIESYNRAIATLKAERGNHEK